jgi:hypothetical protein
MNGKTNDQRQKTKDERRKTRSGKPFRVFGLSSLVFGLLFVGCGAKQDGREPVHIRTLAVLPIEPASDSKTKLAPEAGDSVTAQIYRVLADQTEFKFVADLTIADTVITPEVRNAGGLAERAVALGKQVGADGVIFGRVFRYQKRVGTEFGASEPASVGFELSLVAVPTGEVVWTGSFDETQQPLTSNLFNWWMFWSAGPRWFSAGELAGLGVEKLFDDMSAAVTTEES